MSRKARTSNIITLPYPPSINHYYIRKGRAVLLNEKAAAYRMEAGLKANQQVKECLTGDVKVTIQLYRPAYAPDIDNGLKAVLDALNGIAYEDDGNITELHVYRYDNSHEPCVLVGVEKA
jgi:crossover junction endodeoxyribonuclease RusA